MEYWGKVKVRHYKERPATIDKLMYMPAPKPEKSFYPSPEDQMIKKQSSMTIEKMLKMLKPKEEQVLRMIYGIGEGEHKRKEVAKEMDVCRNRICQLEHRAIERITRNPKRVRELKEIYTPKPTNSFYKQ
jgi:RNA polymerase sigma factor (sigma-70 family)